LVVVVVFVALQAVEVVGPSRFLPLTADLADLRVGRGVVERGPVVFVLVSEESPLREPRSSSPEESPFLFRLAPRPMRSSSSSSSSSSL
jgi:hypothetical protein